MNNEVNNGYDWYKSKVVNVSQRGTLALVATATLRNGRLIDSEIAKQRYIWPSSVSNDSKILSRRIWSKEA